MGRNEIRLRRQMMGTRRWERHRNYANLMMRHERENRFKRIIRVFIYFLIIAFLLIIFFIVVRWEQREGQKNVKTLESTGYVMKNKPPLQT